MPFASRPPRTPTVLIIMDGFGVNPGKHNNAIYAANTPRLDAYFAQHVHTLLDCAGHAVGLPEGQMGNSEVGHLTLGCGSIVRQDLVRIDDAIENGEFAQNAALVQAIEAAKAKQRPLHLIGLVSEGGVHSHTRHLKALLALCGAHQVKPLLHVITDGRDTAPKSAGTSLQGIAKDLAAVGGQVATLSGRYYAMDRDQRWERTEKAFNALVHGEGAVFEDVLVALDDAYNAGETDEFITPRILCPEGRMQNDDEVIFFNFRNDRPRQLTQALTQAAFAGFARGAFQGLRVTTLTQYDPNYGLPVAFMPDRPGVTLAEIISQAGVAQFHCAETEKYAHVTFFFNGGKEEPFAGETRVMVPSPKVATYDLQPEMSAVEVADAVVEAIQAEQYGFIIVNFANGDMVGHTAVREAVIKAVEALDEAVGRVLDAAQAKGYAVILTADHGNCEELIDPLTGEPHTQHSMYPVPCLIIDQSPWRLRTGAGLSAIAPTVLQLMGIAQPESMQGRSLLLDP